MTMYCVYVRFVNKTETIERFDSALARALYIISLVHNRGDILREWVEEDAS